MSKEKDNLVAITVQINEDDYEDLVTHYRDKSPSERMGTPLAAIRGVVQWNEFMERRELKKC